MIDRYLLSIDKEILSYHGKWCKSDDVAELERNLKESLDCNNELLKIIKELRGLK